MNISRIILLCLKHNKIICLKGKQQSYLVDKKNTRFLIIYKNNMFCCFQVLLISSYIFKEFSLCLTVNVFTHIITMLLTRLIA